MSTETVPLKDFVVLLRAAGSQMTAAEMLYVAADLLTPGRNPAQRASNRTVVEMVARLLDLPLTDETDPAVVERVLRNLPDIPENIKRGRR